MATLESSIALYDYFSPVLNNIMDAMNLTIASVHDLQSSMNGSVDVSSFEAAENAIHQAGEAMETLNRQMREAGGRVDVDIPNPEPVNVPVHWRVDNMEVFTNTGIERFRQEVQSTNTMLNALTQTQTQITATAGRMDILPPQANADIASMGSRLQAIQQRIQMIEGNSLNFGTEEANNGLEYMRSVMAELMEEQSRLSSAMASMDVQSANASYLNLSRNIATIERYIRNNTDAQGRFNSIVSHTTWTQDNMQIFNNTGVERFQQEIQSANTMMNTLFHTQVQVASAAGRMDILPPQANADIASMGSRLQAIQQRIQTIESNPLNVGSEEANAELERMRMQLANAMNAQNDLNEALQRMDVRAANDAYLRLSGTVSNTERYLRDNVDEQGRFNQQIRDGTTASNGLLASIKKIAGAYMGIQGLKKVIELSDTTAQTEARLSLIVDDGGSVEELQNQIYASAQEARASYQDTANVVAKLGLQAKDAFSGTDEMVAFSELMSKNFKIAGASTSEQTSAMYQLTQAMSSGKLQGDEYRSIVENAPLLANAIKDYMVNVQQAEGSMKDWASEGLLTADVIKAALFTSADEINERFEQMPMTFAEVGTSIKNQALMTFQPVLKKLNDLANSDRFASMVNGVIGALSILASAAIEVFDLFTTGAAFIYDNWSFIGPVFYAVAGAVGFFTIAAGANAIALKAQAIASGVASLAANVHRAAVARQAGATFKATAAQYGFNAALLACPITWIVLGIIAIIAAIGIVTAVINKVCDTSISAAGMIVGTIFYIMGAITNCGLLLDNIFFGAIEAAKATGNNIKEAFTASIKVVESIFYGLAAVALGVISDIAAQLAKLPFIEFDAAGLSEAAGKYASEMALKGKEAASYTPDYQDIGAAWDKGFNTYEYLDLDAEFDRGYEWGENLQNKISGMFSKDESQNETTDYSSLLDGLGGIADNTGATAGNTADIADALEITDEDLKYLCDIASREVIDRTVLKSVSIDMSGMVNKVENIQDLDGITTTLEKELRKQMAVSMEGA